MRGKTRPHGGPLVSVVVPVYRTADTLQPLRIRVGATLDAAGLPVRADRRRRRLPRRFGQGGPDHGGTRRMRSRSHAPSQPGAASRGGFRYGRGPRRLDRRPRRGSSGSARGNPRADRAGQRRLRHRLCRKAGGLRVCGQTPHVADVQASAPLAHRRPARRGPLRARVAPCGQAHRGTGARPGLRGGHGGLVRSAHDFRAGVTRPATVRRIGLFVCWPLAKRRGGYRVGLLGQAGGAARAWRRRWELRQPTATSWRTTRSRSSTSSTTPSPGWCRGRRVISIAT